MEFNSGFKGLKAITFKQGSFSPEK